MTWRVVVQPPAARRLSKMGSPERARILRFLRDRVATADNPRDMGAPLRGGENLWRYRVGDYRIIVRIDDGTVTVLVLDLGHRREIYR